MTVGPRIVFVRFLTRKSPKVVPWVNHSYRVIGAPVALDETDNDSDQGLVVWQLVSANNRQLVRGAELHSTYDAAREHAAHVVESAAHLTVTLVSETERGLYGWYMSLDDVPAAICARWYLTERDRRHAIDLAARSIPVAMLHSGARLTDLSLMAGDRVPLA